MRNRVFRINAVLPILVLCIFAMLAVAVTSEAAGAYKREQLRTEQNYSSRIISSYVTEKVRQADPGSVTIGTVGKQPALFIRSQVTGSGETGNQESTGLLTCIYQYDGELMEQTVRQGDPVSPSGGTAIAKARVFTPVEESPGLLKLVYVGEGDTVMATYVKF